METIGDLSWMGQLAGGALERFDLRGFSIAVVSPTGSRASVRGGTYLFRLLASPPGDRRPVYAINLESSILGDWLLTEQIGHAHSVLEHLAAPLSHEEFRIRALERLLSRFDGPDFSGAAASV
jgi:hypothetical protein